MKNVSVMQRLRASGLRPTVARIGVLQVLLSAAPHALSRDEIYRQLYLRGTPVSVGTVTRGVAISPLKLSLRRRSILPVTVFRNVPASSFARIRGMNGGIAFSIVTVIEAVLHLLRYARSHISYEILYTPESVDVGIMNFPF